MRPEQAGLWPSAQGAWGWRRGRPRRRKPGRASRPGRTGRRLARCAQWLRRL